MKYSINSLISKTPQERIRLLNQLDDNDLEFLLKDWRFWARKKQLPPPGDWTFWAIICGRGWGKGWTGSNWVIERASLYPDKLIGLWGQTSPDVKKSMIEDNPSSILKQSPPWFKPEYQRSNRRLLWPNGAVAELYYGDVPDQARGPDLMTVWIDELAKFKYADKCWDNIEFCLREDPDPRGIITTTPRPIKVIKDLVIDENTHVTGGSLYENKANLSNKFIRRIERKYEGTDLGKQEIHGKIVLANLEGRIYKRFDSSIHVDAIDPHKIAASKQVKWYMTCDFNVCPCIWELAIYDGETLSFFDEIAMRDVDTRTMCIEALSRWKKLGIQISEVILAGDASGGSRSTQGYESDYEIMEEYGFFTSIVPRQNPRVRDRFNCVNSAFYNNEVEVDPKCRELIKDYEEVIWKEGAKNIVDTSDKDRTHAGDASGYLIYPIFGWEELEVHSEQVNM